MYKSRFSTIFVTRKSMCKDCVRYRYHITTIINHSINEANTQNSAAGPIAQDLDKAELGLSEGLADAEVAEAEPVDDPA